MYCFVLHIGIYINIVQIAKRHTSPVLAFNMQTWPNILPDLVFACWKQAHGLCVSLLFVQYRYNPICKPKQYIYKNKKHALLSFAYLWQGIHWFCDYMYVIWSFIQQPRLDQSVEHQTWNLRAVGSSPTVGQNFSFCILSLPMRSWEVDWSHANEIKHDVQPRYIGA